MIPKNPFIDRASNCLPRLSQVLTDDVSQWETWTKTYVVEDEWGFKLTPCLLRATFDYRRGRQVRAFVDSLKSGRCVFVPCGTSLKRDDKESRRIGKLLWERVVKARGRRFDYDGPITRPEVMYVSRFPEADLRGKELHHINQGRTHVLWKMQLKARLSGARLRRVDNLDNLLLALDDRPRNLIALTPREHFLIHLIEGTPYYGKFIGDASEAGEESVRLELFKKVRNAMNQGNLTEILNPGSHCNRVAWYDKKGFRARTLVNGSFKVMYVISDWILSKSRKYGLGSA